MTQEGERLSFKIDRLSDGLNQALKRCNAMSNVIRRYTDNNPSKRVAILDRLLSNLQTQEKECTEATTHHAGLSESIRKMCADMEEERSVNKSIVSEVVRMSEECAQFHERMQTMRTGDVWYDSQGNSHCSNYCMTREAGHDSIAYPNRKENTTVPDSMFTIYEYSRDYDLWRKMVDPRDRKRAAGKKKAPTAKRRKKGTVQKPAPPPTSGS